MLAVFTTLVLAMERRPVTASSRLVPDFIDLALRLKPGETGIVKSQWGFHVMQRVK